MASLWPVNRTTRNIFIEGTSKFDVCSNGCFVNECTGDFLPATRNIAFVLEGRRGRFRHPSAMQSNLRQLPDPSPPPIKEPPDGPENPDVPVREPDPEPFQM